MLVLNSATISANAGFGTGGNVNITVDSLLQTDDSAITATAERGIDGMLSIDAAETDLPADLAILTTAPVDSSSLLHSSCAAREFEGSSFAVYRRRAPPTDPKSLLGWTGHEPPPAAEQCGYGGEAS